MTKAVEAVQYLDAMDELERAEQEAQYLHQAGRALRALSDISRTSSLTEAQHFDTLRRDDMSALLEVIGDQIMARSRTVDGLIAQAARRSATPL
jgi:hypothetical protein